MTASYYFWKWAENDLPGRPTEVHAALLRGELHPALQIFDARPLVARLREAAAEGVARGEEWDWKLPPKCSAEQVGFVFITGPLFTRNEETLIRVYDRFIPLDLSGCHAESGALIEFFSPKLNLMKRGQFPHEPAHDICVDDLPALILPISATLPDPFAAIENRRSDFVQCLKKRHRYCVEWHESHDIIDRTKFDHWRAQNPARMAALGGAFIDEPLPYAKDPDLLRHADMLRIFTAFLRGEPRPARYEWRNINDIIK